MKISSAHSPRRLVVMAGVSLSHMLVSQIIATSAASSSFAASRKPGRFAPPDSSSPSSSTVTGIGSLPVTAFQARQASTKVISWPLSSEAPRPRISLLPSWQRHDHRVERLVCPQFQRIDRLHVVVAVEQHLGALGRVILGQHDRVAGRVAHLGLEADRGEVGRMPFAHWRAFRRHRPDRSRSTSAAPSGTAGRAHCRDRRRYGRGRRQDQTWQKPPSTDLDVMSGRTAMRLCSRGQPGMAVANGQIIGTRKTAMMKNQISMGRPSFQ